MAGPKRAWFGMWDHVRGNDTDASGRLLMGRADWFDEVMRFYDDHLKGSRRRSDDVPAPRQLHRRRAEQRHRRGRLPNGRGVRTISPPLPYAAHLAGVPKATVDASALLPNANLVVDVYDIDSANNATLISRNASLIAKTGATSLDLYGDDWKIARGHRIGVLVTGANAEWWAHVPMLQTVTVRGGSISLPFLARTRPDTIRGDPSVKLESYKADAPFAVPAATIATGTSPSVGIPSQQTPAP